MKKLYFIIPIAALAIFIFFYLNAKNGIEEAERNRKAQEQQKLEERQRKEEADRKRAWEDANRQALERIAEIKARQDKEKQQAEQRQAAKDERDMAYREKDNLNKQIQALQENLQVTKDQKSKVEEQLKIQRAQVDYLKTAAKDVALTKASYETALQKLQKAEDDYNKLLPDLQRAVNAAAAATAAAAARRN